LYNAYLFKEIITENFPNVEKDTNTRNGKIKDHSSDSAQPSLHIITKLSKVKDKERILK
jgi:hypothetical protein